MAIRNCNMCDKTYHVYNTDDGTYLKYFCSKICETLADGSKIDVEATIKINKDDSFKITTIHNEI